MPTPNILRQYPKSVALAAGFASATGFAPLDLWPVTLACLVLLIALLEHAEDRRGAFARGWCFGLGHFALGLNWIAHAFTFQDAMPHWFGYGAVVLLSLYLAVYPGFALLAAWWANTWLSQGRSIGWQDRWRLPLLLAALWIWTEYLRATLFTGFAWNPLGVIWVPTLWALFATEIGTYGLSGLTLLVAGGLLRLTQYFARSWREGHRVPKGSDWIAVGFGGIFILPVLAASSGLVALPGPPVSANAPAIRVVQPNIGQQDKYAAGFEAKNFAKLATLSGEPSTRPRLVFWPEAAIPAYLDIEPEWRQKLALLMGPGDLLMTGGDKIHFKEENRGLYTDHVMTGANNSLWVVTSDGRLIGRYDKAHLVPYGEYLPMRPILSAIGLSRLVPGDIDFWPGPGPRTLDLPAAPGRPALKMGVQICYEIIFSGQVVDAKNRPDFLFNPSNDAWFGSWGPPQHLAQARLRAIEEGLPVIRSTPTGISAIVDVDGAILHSLPHHEAGFIDAVLPPAAPPTLFAHMGNWAPMLGALVLAGLAIATGRRRS